MSLTSRALAICVLATMLAACSPQPDEQTGTAAAPAPLRLDVYTSNDYGYSTTSAIVYGEREAVLIDPQFLASDARQVADMIRASGKRLTAVYATHAHPDHYFGAAAIKDAFPEARFVALPEVATQIAAGWTRSRNNFYKTYGDEAPPETPVAFEPLAEPRLMLEGHALEIIGDVVGDAPGNSFVWIPSIRAVVTGDIVYYSRHIPVPPDRGPWLETLNRIDALGPAIVVPGHKGPGVDNDPAATGWMRRYWEDFEAFKAASGSAAALKTKMLAKYPNAAMPARLDEAVALAFPDK